MLVLPMMVAGGLFYFLFAKHSVKLMEEQEVFTSRTTRGLFWQVIWSEEDRIWFCDRYEVELPNIDFTKHNILVSDGRRIVKLSYRIISKTRTYHHSLIGEEVFNSQHYPHSMFVYRVKKIGIRQFWD